MQISPWKASTNVANLVPFPRGVALSCDAVAKAVDEAMAYGYTEAYTAAMPPAQAVPFMTSGFDIVEELHLLRRPLGEEPVGDRSRLRRGRRLDHDEILAFDRLAFDEFWRFDRANLIDAMRATPRHRFVVTRTTPVVGYHITGLAGTDAYLQRVAVDPTAHGQGWGTSLVTDSLRWAWRNGAMTAHVNTQVTNEAAVALYEKCGFEFASHRLRVLHRQLG